MFASAVLVLGATSAQAAMVVSGDATKNVSCAAGVCTATARFAVLNAGELTGMLASSDLTLQSGVLARDIILRTAFSWTGANRLTLDSRRSILVNRMMTVTGSGALTLTTNDGGTGGLLSFTSPGRVVFWDLSSSLIIDGDASYTLVGDIATLASDIASNPSGHFALANNYDASVDGTYSHSPVTTTFAGAFDGLGNAVSRLRIVDATVAENVGLFQQLASQAAVVHLRMVGEHVEGAGQSMAGGIAGLSNGSLAGDSVSGRISTGNARFIHHVFHQAAAGALVGLSNGTIADSQTSGTVVGGNEAWTGGAVGWSKGSIANSSSNSFVTYASSKSYGGAAGGLVGQNEGTITDSFGAGNLAVLNGFVGGFVGDNYFGNIIRCHANGSVTDQLGGTAGGFVGANGGSIDSSYATGNLTDNGNAQVAGFVGFNQTLEPVRLTNSYSTGSVTAGPNSYVGGFVGTNDRGPIQSAYATGALSGGQYLGGFLAYDADSVDTFSDAYWDLDTTGVSAPGKGAGNVTNDPGITGLTDTQLKSGLPAGFDPVIWAEDPGINGGLPYLIANPPR